MTAAMNDRTTFQSSELSRSPGDVFAAAASHPVDVTRRDGETLVLMTKGANNAQKSLLQLAAQLIAVATSTDGTFAERMSDRFPWMLALSATDQKACAEEILNAARASFATNQPHLAIAELTAWQETATAIAAGLGNEPIEWLDEPIAVERP